MSVNPPGGPPATPAPAGPTQAAPHPQGVVIDCLPVAWQAVCYLTDPTGNRVIAWQGSSGHPTPEAALAEAQQWLTRQVPHP